MRKNISALLLCSLLCVIAFAGCGHNDTDVGDSVDQVSQTDYETITPPEDGWTIEELLNVTYLCGKQLSYPLTCEALGDDFTVETQEVTKIKNRVVTHTNYKGEYFSPCIFEEDSNGELNFEKFKSVSFSLPEKTDTFDFVINGFGFDNTQDEIESALGAPDKFDEIANVYYYYDKTIDKERLEIFFIDEKPAEFIFNFGKE